MMDLEGSGRYLIEVWSQYFPGKLRIAGDQAGIGTKHLPNVSVYRYRQTSLFALSLVIFIFVILLRRFRNVLCSLLNPCAACFDILPNYKNVYSQHHVKRVKLSVYLIL
jgi:hypothetical protein